jgi:large subunit ribosomal protein L29
MKIIKELKSQSPAQLQEKLEEFKKELLKLNAQVSAGANTENPGKLRQLKRNIARILTIMNQNRRGVK